MPKKTGNGIEIGKEIKGEQKDEQKSVEAKAEHKPLTKEELAIKKKFEDIDSAMRKFDMYPVAANWEAKNQALEALRQLYVSGEPRVKQVILYVLQENLAKYGEYRIPKNMDHFRKKFPQNTPVQNRMAVYGGMFNYSNSLEGLIEIVGLLSDLGDDDSAKVLTHNFSFLCSFDGSEGARMLRNAVVDALGNTKSVYALRAILSYAKHAESEQLGGRVIAAVMQWKEKVRELKIDQKEKEQLVAKINELVLVEAEEGHYR